MLLIQYKVNDLLLGTSVQRLLENKMKNLIAKVYNCEKENAAIGILNGLLWAAVILLGAWLTRGSENADAVFIILLSASTTAFLFAERQRKNK